MLAQATELLEASKAAGFVGVLLAVLLLSVGTAVLALWRWLKPLAEKWIESQIQCTQDVAATLKEFAAARQMEEELRKKDSEISRQMASAYSALASVVAMLSTRLGMHEGTVLMIVEDCGFQAKVMLSQLRDVARKHKLDVLHVMTLREARLHAWEARLIILDVGLPDVLDAEHEIGDFVRLSFAPVIIYTASDHFECAEAKSVITKGASPEILIQAIERALTERRESVSLDQLGRRFGV